MKIFISYRRNDTRDLSGRVADRLRAHPRLGDVFFDVSSIEVGESFIAAIKSALTRDPVCVVMIGPAWRGPNPDGTSRIDDVRDVVRAEVFTALAEGLRVIPVLAGGATMPSPESLPEPLRSLPTLNAVLLRHESFDQDMDRLIDAILRRRRDGALAQWMADHAKLAAALYAACGMVLALLALMMLAVLHRVLLGRSLDESLGGPGPVWILIAVALAAGTWLGFSRGRRPL